MDLTKAKQVLEQAYEIAQNSEKPTCSHQDFIDSIIDNTHLTFRYILFTALLSKATDTSINPLCLQSRSTLPGSYDARSVCHKVIVPFEITTLAKVLGGSNEPFLNKPARFPELKKTNAVRAGNDQKLLDLLCDNLPKITTSKDAKECLVYMLHKLISIQAKQRELIDVQIPDSSNLPSKLLHFINTALEKSFEGETLTLLVAGIYHLQYNEPDAIVEVHPVNQCGASGREISDLDIYINDKLITSNELKDKSFSETDVRHAADKVLRSGGNRMLFIAGPRGETLDDMQKVQAEYAEKNLMVKIINSDAFFSSMLGVIRTIDCEEFMHFILESAHETKFKEEVIAYLSELSVKLLK